MTPRRKPADLSGWGRALRASMDVSRPDRLADITCAPLTGPAIGARRSYGDAALRGQGMATDMTRLDRISGFDPRTGLAEVEAGARLGDLLAAFSRHGWMPKVLPGTGHATLGGAIALDVHGKNHHRDGSFGQHLAGLTLLLPSGEQRQITPADDLFAATLGGLGQTGIVLRARLQLAKCPGNAARVTENRADGLDEHLSLLDDPKADYCVGWLDATASGADLGRGIVEVAKLVASEVRARPAGRKVPFDAPAFALSPPVVRLFNRAYFGRVPAEGRSIIRPVSDFFFPLDRIGDWNRLYGRRGFHQFQCVIPDRNIAALREMLARIAASGLASPLAVLKRMGAGRAGLISFPAEGYTLAVDFPNSRAAAALIATLHDLTRAAEGRIYFAKDSLCPPELVPAMYPELPRWQALVAEADPERTLLTDLVRRLKLREAP